MANMTMWTKTRFLAATIAAAAVLSGIGNAGAEQSPAQDAGAGGARLLDGVPSVTKVGEAYEISFKVARPTDVTVRILDGDGKVVRHLACGVVGLSKAAKGFAGDSLVQRIAWDGRDDSGKPAPPGCKAWVGVGMRAKFERFLFWNPQRMGPRIGAIATSDKGELYVATKGGLHDGCLRVFDKDGKFLRRAWPFSPALPGAAEFFAGKYAWHGEPMPAGVPDYEGNIVPLSVQHAATYYFYTSATGMGVGPSGVAFGNWGWGPRVPLWVMKDGFPLRQYLRAPWGQGSGSHALHMRVAVGPDGDFYCVHRERNVLARLDGETLEPVKSFGGDYIIRLNSPVSVAVDSKGNIWATDAGGLTIFDKAGKVLRTVKELNGQLGCNLKTGAIYLQHDNKLLKFASHEDLTAVAEHKVSRDASHVAVDSVNNIVWLLGAEGRDSVVRLEDKGKSFAARVIPDSPKTSVVFPMYPAASGDKVYLSSYIQQGVYVGDADGGEPKVLIGRHGSQCGNASPCVDAAGNFYVSLQSKWTSVSVIEKYGPDGRRLKFGQKENIAPEPEVARFRGVSVGPGGDIYVAAILKTPSSDQIKPLVEAGKTKARFEISRIDVYAPDGTLKKEALVRFTDDFRVLKGRRGYTFYPHGCHGVTNGVAVARDGSIYTVAAHVHNGQPTVGSFWGGGYTRKANLPEPARWRYSVVDKLVKFAPGGGVKAPDQSDILWEHPGISPTAGWGCSAYECPTAQISIDADDRVWCHDAALYNVKAVDGAGNLILRVGVYGNEDCKGGGGDRKLEGTDIVIDPEVPLSRPTGAAVANDRLFIADQYANRLVRCRLEFSQTEQVDLGAPAGSR